MNYWTQKEINKEKAKEHVEDMYERFSNEIKYSIEHTEIYDEDDCLELLKANDDRVNSGVVNIVFDKIGISEAVCKTKSKSKKKKLCVLNFASYTNPGGMFIKGSSAQEECICHSSTLYPIIQSFEDTFYKWNKKNKNHGLYKHRMLYTPDVIFISEKGAIFKADVITLAAPNRGVALLNGVSETEIVETMRQRIKILLQVAYIHLVDTLFLGAYGCGVFKNDPKKVSKMFYDELGKYEMLYKFPIPDTANYKVFLENASIFMDNELGLFLTEKYKRTNFTDDEYETLDSVEIRNF